MRNIELRREIFKSDAEKIIDWLEDYDVNQHLNESQNVNDNIRKIIYRVNMPILTHVFNQDGTFFMVTTPSKGPIGFLRLIPKNHHTEMVVVIGDKKEWGKGFGFKAVLEGLKHAFFKWREDKVIAKISHENGRSKRVFKKAGFSHDKELTCETQYSISVNKFLQVIN
ncbi:MAG: GNAT family acetyltransferase [Peptococcaceae bacterium BICA1-8]|nr:MAG: GNAT family acetyltransferase [Peptococcaceae bacterium BICA1-8]